MGTIAREPHRQRGKHCLGAKPSNEALTSPGECRGFFIAPRVRALGAFLCPLGPGVRSTQAARGHAGTRARKHGAQWRHASTRRLRPHGPSRHQTLRLPVNTATGRALPRADTRSPTAREHGAEAGRLDLLVNAGAKAAREHCS